MTIELSYSSFVTTTYYTYGVSTYNINKIATSTSGGSYKIDSL